ncbi:MAG: insulinase family protein [SAR202 cluster bacterium]|nr:insulinase family protein [SAR202 cluster bacterium]
MAIQTRIETGRPTFQKTTLDNGLRIFTSAMPHVRSVTINLLVGVGSRYESDDRAGISHVVEHLVFKGTTERPTPADISGTIEGVGGVINAGTEQELTVYWCKVARPYMEESIDLLIDMVRNSVYSKEELERERMVVVEELGMVNDYPNYKADAMIDEMLWPAQPLGRDIAGTRETVMAMTRDMVVDHVERHYSPSNIVISIAGNVDHDDVVRYIDAISHDWQPHATPGWTPFTGSQAAPAARLEYRKTEQAHLCIGLPALSVTHPDRFIVDLMSVILGEGMTSRLFMEVRERRGLAYDIHSEVSYFRDCGAMVINAGVDPKRLHNAVEVILAEVARLRQGVPSDELQKAKRLSTGRLMLRMEDTKSVSAWMGTQELLLGKVLEVEQVVESINAVTEQDIQRLAGQLLVEKGLNVAVVGPSKAARKLESLLKL